LKVSNFETSEITMSYVSGILGDWGVDSIRNPS